MRIFTILAIIVTGLLASVAPLAAAPPRRSSRPGATYC